MDALLIPGSSTSAPHFPLVGPQNRLPTHSEQRFGALICSKRGSIWSLWWRVLLATPSCRSPPPFFEVYNSVRGPFFLGWGSGREEKILYWKVSRGEGVFCAIGRRTGQTCRIGESLCCCSDSEIVRVEELGLPFGDCAVFSCRACEKSS